MSLDASFQEFLFPTDCSIVYVIGFKSGEQFIPIYVGESDRHLGRIGDYCSAQFTAQTDFKVGRAAKYLLERGVRVLVKYRNSKDRKKDEAHLKQEFKAQGFKLLNDLLGYRYKTASEEEELKRVRDFIDGVLNRS